MSSRTLTAMLLVLAVAGHARAQSYLLAEAPLADKFFRIELDMSLTGELKVQQEGKSLTMKQTARARHGFVERVLEAGKTGLVDKTARIYQTAQAEIVVDKERSERKFRDNRRFMVAQRVKDQVFVYCPDGPLQREELELTEHFDTLSPAGLLPGSEVKVGDTWKPVNAAVQGLLDLDGLISQDLNCKLVKVEGQLAHVSLSGTANGIDSGSAVKMSVTGAYRFDLKSRRLTEIDWKQHDEREQGPVTPAFSADIVTQVKRTPIDAVAELNDSFLGGKLPTGSIPESMTRLVFREPRGRYTLVHGRDWNLVALSERQLVMRLMDQGDFVAQVTITPWKKAEPGKHLSEEEFKQVISQTPGWEQDGTPDQGTKIDDPANKYWIYRVGTSGNLNGVKAVQYFYLVAGPQGDQLVVAFTMPPALAAKLNTRDLDLIRGLQLAEPKESGLSSRR